MAKYTAAVLLLILLLSADAFQLPQLRKTSCIRLPSSPLMAVSSEDLADLTVTELKSRLRTAGLPVVGAKKDLIERLGTPAPVAAKAEGAVKKVSRLGGLLSRRKPKTAAVADDNDDHKEEEVKEDKEEVMEMPVIAVKKAHVVAKMIVAPVKQWESRKDLSTKAPTVEVKRVAVAAPVQREESAPVARVSVPVVAREEMKKTPVLDSKKPIKSVKQVVAAYDIDDDDFMSQFMDEGEKGQAAAQRPVAPRPASSAPRAPVGENTDGAERQAWPGPGVSWMPGPTENNQKQDQNRGRNTLMAAADDDLQRMVDERNEARYRRDYDGADAIREELRTIYRVEIYDKLGEWVAADGRWGLSNRKRGAGQEDGVPVLAKIQGDAKPCTLTYDQIMDQVVKRTTARRTRQFQVADDIRDELARVGVELFDKVNEWRTYDGAMRGIQSEDFEKYEVKKDNERYDRGNSRDNAGKNMDKAW